LVTLSNSTLKGSQNVGDRTSAPPSGSAIT
jgi:hypothetical protein